MRFLFIFPLLGLTLGQDPTALVNLVDTLKTSSLESILVDLIDAAGLTEALSQGGPFTIFAPDNHAFNLLGNDTLNSLKADPAKLADILKYHVVSGLYHVKPDLLVNELMLDSLKGDKLRVNYYYAARHTLTVEGARITYPDKMASNGIIHRIEKVLMPPVGNIVEVLTQDGSFNTLIAAAKAAGLVEALGDGPITLMAPTDAAFNRLGNDTVNKLLQNPKLLGDVLKYHILHGTLYSKGMHSGSFHTLEEADRLRIYQSFFGTVIVGGHRVTKPDMSATNGVVHKLDYVLVPSSLNVLKYHILHGTLYSKVMHSGSFHTLEEADRLRIYQSFFGSVIVGGHRVTKPDMSATNGVVHKLDYVLVPSSLSTQIKNL